MLTMQSMKTVVPENGYTIEYTITKNLNESEPEMMEEYGIRCTLFEADKVISAEEIKCITPVLSKVNEMVMILRKNRVFPAHLKDVVYDLLVLEEENIQAADFCVA